MAGKAGLKAGLLGVVIMLVWTVIGQLVPMTGAMRWISTAVSLVLYAGVGVLAGLFLAPPRTPGKGAGAGAIAGVISGLIAGAVGMVILFVQMSRGAGSIPGLTAEQVQQMEQVAESGMDPTTLIAIAAVPSVACIMAVGSGLAAIGGAIIGAVKPD